MGNDKELAFKFVYIVTVVMYLPQTHYVTGYISTSLLLLYVVMKLAASCIHASNT